MRIGDADHPASHLQDAPRAVAELKNIAGVAFNREVFVQRAEERPVGIENDPVIGDIRNRPSGCQRRHSRSALVPTTRQMHLIAMD